MHGCPGSMLCPRRIESTLQSLIFPSEQRGTVQVVQVVQASITVGVSALRASRPKSTRTVRRATNGQSLQPDRRCSVWDLRNLKFRSTGRPIAAKFLFLISRGFGSRPLGVMLDKVIWISDIVPDKGRRYFEQQLGQEIAFTQDNL